MQGDLHFVRGTMPGMREGTVLGHEAVGVVREVGSGVRNLREGDRVVVASTIGCGSCSYCRAGYYAQCDNANPHGPRAGTARSCSPTSSPRAGSGRGSPRSARATPWRCSAPARAAAGAGRIVNHRRYLPDLVGLTASGALDTSPLVWARTADVLDAYRNFDRREAGWTRVAFEVAPSESVPAGLGTGASTTAGSAAGGTR